MKILFITSNRIGDAVLSTGLLNHVIREYPDSRITLACGPLAAPLFAETPNIDRIIELVKGTGHWRKLWRETVGTRWDLVVDLRASAFVYFVRARKRRTYRPSDEPVHRVVQLSRFYGLAEPAAPGLWFGQKQVAAAKALIPPGDPVIALAPTANWAGKQWPASKFADMVLRLTGPRGILEGARVAVFGADAERKVALPLLERIRKDHRIDLVGKVDILTAAACLQQCALFIGNDSGLMHLSAAAYTPTLGLFGPSRDELYAPWGAHCAVVRTKATYDELKASPQWARGASLMGSLSVEAVEAAATDLWNRCHPQQEVAEAAGA